MTMWQRWKQTVKSLKRDILALYWVTQDSRTPRWIKSLVIVIVAYAFSPIDLIPVLGQAENRPVSRLAEIAIVGIQIFAIALLTWIVIGR